MTTEATDWQARAESAERALPATVASLYLVHNHRGQPLTLAAMQKRWDAVRRQIEADWQLRDLRAKAATDAEANAQALLGHAAASTTDGYIRRVAGAVVEPVRRPIQPTNGC